MNLCLVSSANIRKIHSLRNVRSTNRHVRNYPLCRQCAKFLCVAELGVTNKELNKRKEWKNTWAAFFRDLLFGTQTTDNLHFYDIYSGPHLWKFIPKEMRRYWIDAIQNAFYNNGSKVYQGCTLDEPTPYFTDWTTKIDSF